MLKCLQDAKWVYAQFDKEQNVAAMLGFTRPGLANIAAALYQVKMSRKDGGW